MKPAELESYRVMNFGGCEGFYGNHGVLRDLNSKALGSQWLKKVNSTKIT